MGQYINKVQGEYLGSTFDQKCDTLKDLGAIEADGEQFQKDLICVVDNGRFAAVAYAYNAAEYEEFKSPCGRRKQWYTLEDASEHVD